MKQTRVVTESWIIPFFPFWDLFSSALSPELIITLAGASPASHGGRRKVERSKEGKGWVSPTIAWVGARWCYATRIVFSPFYPATQERESWWISVFPTHAFSIVLCAVVLVYLLLPGFGKVNFWDVQEDIVAIYQAEWWGRGKRGTDQGRFIKMKRVWRRIMRAYDLATQIKKT